MNFEGTAVGAASLLIISAFRPLAIWCEFHLTQGGPAFLIMDLSCRIAALWRQGIWSLLQGLLGASRLWSIREPKKETPSDISRRVSL